MVVNFDTKEIVPGASPIGIAIVGSLVAILGGVFLMRRRRLTPTLG